MSNWVLVVDDEKNVRTMWTSALKDAGFYVRAAESAQVALDLCDEHTFDLAVVDFFIPSITGVELLFRIRRKLPLIRSIVVSGKLDQSVDETTMRKQISEAVEADLFLHKPVSNEKLVAAAQELLKAETSKEWKAIAQDVLKGIDAKLKAAKAAEKRLRALKLGGKKK